MNACKFSADRAYRYSLVHRIDDFLIGPAESFVLWLMLNPSTADETKLDPTLKRCRAFTMAFGHGIFAVANLFGIRSADPRYMLNHAEPVGAENDAAILDLANRASVIIAAWGTDGAHRGRADQVLAMLRHRTIHALHVTKEGFPGHPLYLPATLKPVVYREAA